MSRYHRPGEEAQLSHSDRDHVASRLWHGAGRSGEELFGTGGMGDSGSDQAMQRNVARLFSERGPIFGEVAFTQNSILAGTPLST